MLYTLQAIVEPIHEEDYFKFSVVLISTSTKCLEATDKGVFIISAITTDQELQAVDLAVSMHANGDDAVDVPAYYDDNVNSKVIKIQSYTGN